MFEKKSKNSESLDLGEINLLPEDMRSAAEKYKSSSKGDSAYQLRAPKKIKKRRRVFAWLPFIGGAHWDVTGTPSTPLQAPVPKLSDAVSIDSSGQKESIKQTATPTSNEFGIITPVFGQTAAGATTPGTKRSFKGSISLRNFFNRRRPTVPLRTIAQSSVQGPRPQPSSFATPPRHYSLLEEKVAASHTPLQPVAPPTPIPTFQEPVAPGIRPITPQEKMRSSTSAQKHRRWGLPKWLDIFSLLGMLSRSSKAPKPAVQRKPDIQQGESTPSAAYAPTRPYSLNPIQPVQAPSAHVPTPAVTRVPQTPEGKRPSATSINQRRSWRLPKWLDIFTLLGLFSRAKKPATPVGQKKEEAVAVPQPTIAPTKPYSLNPIQPIETPSVQAPKPAPVQSSITPIATPKSTESSFQAHAPAPQAPVSHAQKPPKVRKPMAWPKWLDIFYLLGLLKWKKRPKSPKPIVPPAKPAIAPVPPPPAAPAVLKTPLTQQAVPSMPPVSYAPRSVFQAPQTTVTPVAPLAPPPSPPQGESSMPSAKTPLVSNDIVPILEPESGSRSKKHAKRGGGLFHMPTKSNFAAVSKELRDINLIPGSFAVARSWKQIGQLLTITALAACGVVGLMYGGLQMWRAQLDKRTVETDAEINAFKDDILVYNRQEPEMSALGNRVDLVQALLGRHLYWTNFFKLLEKYTLTDVYYDGVSASTDGTLTLSAHGPSYETVSQELQLLNSDVAKEFVLEATITGAELGQTENGNEQVNYSISLKLNPKLFYFNAGQN